MRSPKEILTEIESGYIGNVANLSIQELAEVIRWAKDLEAQKLAEYRTTSNGERANVMLWYADGNWTNFDLARIGWRPGEKYPREFRLPCKSSHRASQASPPSDFPHKAFYQERVFKLRDHSSWSHSPQYQEYL